MHDCREQQFQVGIFAGDRVQIDVRTVGGRWLWVVALCAVIGGAAACLLSLTMTPIYRAANKVMITEARTPMGGIYDVLAAERMARTYAGLMMRPSVMDTTFVRLGLNPALVTNQITAVRVRPVCNTQLVALTIEGPDPQVVAAVANTLPSVLVDELRRIQSSRFAASKANLTEQLEEMSRQIATTRLQLGELEQQRTVHEKLEYTELNSALTQYKASYANLLHSYNAVRLAEAQSTGTIVLIGAAVVPRTPVRPHVLVNTLLAAVASALAALGIVCLVKHLDDRVRTPEDLQRIATLPVLGAVGQAPAPSHHPLALPTLHRGISSGDRSAGVSDKSVGACIPDAGAADLISITDPRHPIAEAYRRLRTNLQYYNLDAGLTSLLLTSAEAGEGKSMTSANLAVVMAQGGARVILVDADLRKPSQHRLFSVLRQPGLAEALRSGFSPSLLQSAPGVPNLRLLTSSETVPNPAELLGSRRMQRLVAQLRGEADMLIFDTPPLLAVTDAQVVGHLVDGALVVINSQKTSAGAVHRALQSLAQVNVPVMGAVLNRISGSGRAYYAYDHYYAHDYYHEETTCGTKRERSNEAV